MVFSSLVFMYVFLAVALVTYFWSKDIKIRNTVLCALSVFFYAWGEPLWVILLIVGCIFDYVLGLNIEKQLRIGNMKTAKLLMILSVVENIAVIGLFKYSGFLISNVNGIFGASIPVPSFTLPIGISFFTFQKLSYTIDVYRGNVKAQRSFVNFLLYISMFFQLIAGPIVRYSWVETEMAKRSVNVHEFSKGIKRFCFGLGKKVLLANVAGEFVDKIMTVADPSKNLTTGEAWLGVFMYALQIYYDFSGYSDMAIGLGRMFGFHFPENFKYPYAATTITEFWRRWHISLSSFFRDYVYIPLGGNRRHMLFNIFVVWALTGLWHGASWNYVLWGLFYGVLLVLEKYFVLKPLANAKKNIKRMFKKTTARIINACIFIVQKAIFIYITLMGWTLFYFESTPRLLEYLGVMYGGGAEKSTINAGLLLNNNLWWFLVAILMTQPVLKITKYIALRAQRKHGVLIYTNDIISSVLSIILLVVSTIMLVGNSFNPFLYFRY